MDSRTGDGGIPMIPFVRPVRVGNYKLWRSRHNDVESLNVSNLDGTWLMRIPSTMMMFSTLMQGYQTTDDEMRERFLGMILTNIYNISTISSVAMHDAFFFLSEMMSFPYLLLSEKEMVKRMKAGLRETGMDGKAVKEHIANMVEYRRMLYDLVDRKKADFISEYERQQEERRHRESDEQKGLEHDAIAQQAADILEESPKTGSHGREEESPSDMGDGAGIGEATQ